MQYIFMVLCLFGAVAAMVFIKSLDLSGGLTIALVVPVIFLVIYSLARIQTGDSESLKEVAGK